MFAPHVHDESQRGAHFRRIECRIAVVVHDPAAEPGEERNEKKRIRGVPSQGVARDCISLAKRQGPACFDQFREGVWGGFDRLPVVNKHELVADLVGDQPRLAFPRDNAVAGETFEEGLAHNFIPGTDNACFGEKPHVVRRPENEVGPLASDCGDDERVAQFLAFAVERDDAFFRMQQVVFPDHLLKNRAFRSGLLVPDDHGIDRLPWRGAGGGERQQGGSQDAHEDRRETHGYHPHLTVPGTRWQACKRSGGVFRDCPARSHTA